MRLLSWLYERLTGRPRTRIAPTRKSAPRVHPHLEELEPRVVPSTVTLTVTNDLDSGNGSLRHAVAQAEKSPGKDMIVFAPSLNGHTITLTSGELDITQNLTIQGPGAGLLTISGGGRSRVFEVAPNVTAALSGMTITHGVSYSSASFPVAGGDILNQGTLTLSGCTVSGGHAGYHDWGNGGLGGGISNFGTLTLTTCTVSGNSAADGGGIYNGGTLTVSRSTVSGNSATDGGGGIYDYPGSALTVSDTVFSGNYHSGYLDNILGSYTDLGGNMFK
jgi:predicted outer membrane repeat protein